jgi:cytochrome c-type biogenesis protein CcmH
MSRFIAIFLVLFMGTAQAVIEAYEFESAQTEAEYNQLIKELRCLVCQNQNLAGSNAGLAQDLRRQTYTMLSRGDSPAQVVEYMVARYGDFVIYRPQFKSSTYLLWLGPFLLLIIVLYLVIRKLRSSARPLDVNQETMAEARNLLLREDAEK